MLGLTTVQRFGVGFAVVAAIGVTGCSTVPPAGGTPTPASSAAAPPPHHHDHGGAAPVVPARSGDPSGRLVVHADEQLRHAFGIIVDKFQRAYPGTDVVVEFGASAEHAQHVVDGAAADVFIAGHVSATARVVDHGAARGEPTVIARNPLVIAVASEATGVNGVADLRRPGVRVAFCAERTRCGDAARAVVDVRPATVQVDGPAAVTAVRSGVADAALVHRTDIAAAGADLRVVDFPAGVRHADQYAVVLLDRGRNRTAADAFGTFTRSALAQRVLSDAGFTPA